MFIASLENLIYTPNFQDDLKKLTILPAWIASKQADFRFSMGTPVWRLDRLLYICEPSFYPAAERRGNIIEPDYLHVLRVIKGRIGDEKRIVRGFQLPIPFFFRRAMASLGASLSSLPINNQNRLGGFP
jgi:hypothetical protein